jgi:hypothetical protein
LVTFVFNKYFVPHFKGKLGNEHCKQVRQLLS